MKCDNLQAETIVPQGTTVSLQFYPKAETDAAIAELKTENERLKNEPCNDGEKCGAYWKLYAENERLKAKLESVQATAYADSVDAGMSERRLKRALYKACSNWSKSFKTTSEMLGAHADAVKWDKMERKCREKSKEYL